MTKKQHIKLTRDFTYLYGTIVGTKYKDLTDDQKRILYAAELWKDGMDIDSVTQDMIILAGTGTPGILIKYIDGQLRNTFGYTDEAEVPYLSLANSKETF